MNETETDSELALLKGRSTALWLEADLIRRLKKAKRRMRISQSAIMKLGIVQMLDQIDEGNIPVPRRRAV